MYAPMYALFREPRQAVKIDWCGILATDKQNVDGSQQAPCVRAACLGRDASKASKVKCAYYALDSSVTFSPQPPVTSKSTEALSGQAA